MKLFDKDRFKGRIKWLIIGVLTLLWATLHLWLLREYQEGADEMSNWIKLFIMNHIIWWYIAPIFYGLIGIASLIVAIFNPKLGNE